MIEHKYGEYTSTQIHETKEWMRKQIFFLLLCVDPKTKSEYEKVNVNEAFENVMRKIGGLNGLLFYPREIVGIMSTLNAAYSELNSDNFEYHIYRKLILDAGNEVLKIKEV